MIKKTLFILLSIFINQSAFAFDKLNITPDMSSEGFFTLSWGQSDSIERPLIIQISKQKNFQNLLHEISTGNLQQVHLSGFENGIYYARLLNSNGKPLTQSAQFEVKHRNLNHAFILFFLGLVLFMILAFFLIRSNLQLSRSA